MTIREEERGVDRRHAILSSRRAVLRLRFDKPYVGAIPIAPFPFSFPMTNQGMRE